MSSDSFPDYYRILNLEAIPPPTADDVRTAYKKESLRTHPDRNPRLSEAERKTATENFQKVADAYYVLSDAGRRREYDRLRAERTRQGAGPGQDGASASGAYFSNFFRGASAAPTESDDPVDEEIRPDGHPDADATFAGVFEDMLRPEVHRHMPVWKWVGTASGAALGFIVGNLPGLAMGTYAGNRLGAIRDAKGKSVYAVFTTLDGGQKAAILRGLAAKVLGSGFS